MSCDVMEGVMCNNHAVQCVDVAILSLSFVV